MKATSRRTLPVLTRVIPRKAAPRLTLLMLLALLVCLAALAAGAYATTVTFTAQELLGKPTDTAVTINIVPAAAIQYRYEYGTTSGSYPHETTPVNATGGQPSEVTIGGLSPNTLYYYRMVYTNVADGTIETRTEHTFRTQRAATQSFAFTVTSDSHGAGTNVSNAMTNILNEQPDLHIDLGDTFMIDNTTSQSAVDTAYLSYRKPNYFDKIASSIPIFLSSGNHENEEGWNFDDTPFSIALASVKARKLYYPTPIDNGFYSGNTDPLAALDAGTYGDQYREDYYAWTWGDALFVVIDEFQYTMNLPYSPAAGEGSEPVTGDQWSWTLGQQQYDWLTQTLENSHAKYKFVFSHNMLGGVPRDLQGVGAGYVRGGAEAAGYFEWGGKNANGTDGFAAHRPGWDKTIQQLFVENGVSAYFHGHDHQYVYETRGRRRLPGSPFRRHDVSLRWDLYRGGSRRLQHHQPDNRQRAPTGDGRVGPCDRRPHPQQFHLRRGELLVRHRAQRTVHPEHQRDGFAVGFLKPARDAVRSAELHRLGKQPDGRHPDHGAGRLPDLYDER